MDMVLYSLMKNKINNTPTGQVDNVGGYEIRFVEILPTERDKNTLYFVLGEYKVGDKINIGGKGLDKVVFNDSIIDFGILNGNVFLDKYVNNSPISASFTWKFLLSESMNSTFLK